MTSSARDLRYGRRGGRWAEPWTDADEARYQQALADQQPDELVEQFDLFAQQTTDQPPNPE